MNEISNKRTVVVSGVGMITALGGNREKTWAQLLQGKSGIADSPQGLEAAIYDFVLNGARSRMGDFALVAAEEAIRHAGFSLEEIKGKNIGCAISQSKPILSHHKSPFCHLEKNTQSDLDVSLDETNGFDGPLDASLLMSSFSGWSAEALIKNAHQLKGPSANVVAACATGIASLKWAQFWIESGECDQVLVGASESSLHPLYRSGFEKMGVLAQRKDPKAVKPFDKDRSGFAMGEGACVLFLESLESAQKRNHQPLAILEKTVLQHSSSDSIRFDEDGMAVSRLISETVKESEQPEMINAHGTATLFNDQAEAKGIRQVFGDETEKSHVVSTKSATGHLLGAAGALEAGFCVMSLRDQIVPNTQNLTDPDPICDLNFVMGQPKKVNINKALSLSYGFGGQMGAVLFGMPQ